MRVKGPAEKYGLPVFAHKAAVSFETLTIISCNGKNKIPYYLLLCKSFNIPYFIVFDLDDEKKDASENKRIIDCGGKENIYLFKNSFEDLLGIAKDTDHKCSKVLTLIDQIQIQKDNIPKEILDALEQIADWSAKTQGTGNE